MMKTKLILLVSVCWVQAVFSQSALKPSIGLASIPMDTDPVCYIPMYLGSYDASGLAAGDSAYDFTLYNMAGDSFNLGSVLRNGKPVLLVAGSYTCPVYRGKIPVIDDVISTYAGQLEVITIYTIEAHPDIDTSVYFGAVNTGSANISAGILYRQPTTYGERKVIVSDMVNAISIQSPIYIDGPCNYWWSTYGPAPNNAYLIDTTGRVFAKHGWFHKSPQNIYCDIDSLLGTNSGLCNGGGGGNANFQAVITSNDTIYGPEGTTITLSGELRNNSTTDIGMYARKIISDLPHGWSASICTDVCYNSSTDSAAFILPANSIMQWHVYFYTTMDPDTGFIRLGFRNLVNTSNQFGFNLTAITELATQLNAPTEKSFDVFPNPFSHQVSIIVASEAATSFRLFDIAGKAIQDITFLKEGDRISLHGEKLQSGIYFLQVNNQRFRLVKM